jgi:hypothetical protein
MRLLLQIILHMRSATVLFMLFGNTFLRRFQKAEKYVHVLDNSYLCNK